MVADRVLAVAGVVHVGMSFTAGAAAGAQVSSGSMGVGQSLLIHLLAGLVFSAIHVGSETSLKMLIKPFDVWSDVRPFWAQYQSSLKTFFQAADHTCCG